MSEIKVGENETLESALRRFKRNVQELEFFQKLERENTMKNQALRERRNQKLQERENSSSI